MKQFTFLKVSILTLGLFLLSEIAQAHPRNHRHHRNCRHRVNRRPPIVALLPPVPPPPHVVARRMARKQARMRQRRCQNRMAPMPPRRIMSHRY